MNSQKHLFQITKWQPDAPPLDINNELWPPTTTCSQPCHSNEFSYMLHDFIARVERSGGDIVVIVGGGGVDGIEPL
jgi:hypothetical protein